MTQNTLFSKMSGKMQGIPSICTNPLTNPFCQKMAKNKNTICSSCYSQKMLVGVRSNCVPKFDRVGELLSSSLLPENVIVRLSQKYKVARFSAHGELINMTHLKNYMTIARVNPQVTFGFWTKRVDFVKKLKDRPSNVIFIYSNPFLNDKNPVVPEGFNKIFSVYTKEFAEENGITINCAKRCITCKLCYASNAVTHVNELLK